MLSLQTFFDYNYLHVNTSKTKFMLFTTPQTKTCLPIFTLKYGGADIEQVKSIRFLGVIVNETLTWDMHIQYVCSKLYRSIGSLRRLRKSLPAKLRVSVYHALIQSHVSYAISVWGSGGNPNKLMPVFKCQKHALRCLFSLKGSSNKYSKPGTKTTFNDHHILTVHNQYLLSVLSDVNRDRITGDLVKFSERKTDLAIIPAGKHKYLDPNFHFMGPRLWNAHSCNYSADSRSFKAAIKSKIMDKQASGDPTTWEDTNFN